MIDLEGRLMIHSRTRAMTDLHVPSEPKPLPLLQRLAPPFFYSVLFFLTVPSQWLFSVIEPHPLTKEQKIKFNALAVCIALTYARTWLTDPGRIPSGWAPKENNASDPGERDPSVVDEPKEKRQRWCRKCDAPKPPRAHHCRNCAR